MTWVTVMLCASLASCATGRYTPLGKVATEEIQQLKETVYRVEYRANLFTSQDQLDVYLRRRCAELALREGYDSFHLAQRHDVLIFSRRTTMTVTLHHSRISAGSADLYDAKEVLAEYTTALTSH